MRTARFEVAHTGAYKFHARFVAANNETVWVTESYRTRRAAQAAIHDLVTCVQLGLTVQMVDER